jgi:hypothetical protein
MTNVVTSAAFNEQFTIGTDADGKPVQRTLRDMTADEVGRTMDWHHREAMRLEAETAPYRAMAEAAEAGTLDRDTPADVRWQAVDALREAARAAEKAARLWTLVQLTLQAAQVNHLPLGEAVRRAWPRHAP